MDPTQQFPNVLPWQHATGATTRKYARKKQWVEKTTLFPKLMHHVKGNLGKGVPVEGQAKWVQHVEALETNVVKLRL